jgi:DNA-binding CsgD family transcriptional regulator
MSYPYLTEREQQVLTGMAQGLSNGAVARRMSVAEDTVKTHARQVFAKLGANGRVQAVVRGLQLGLVSAEGLMRVASAPDSLGVIKVPTQAPPSDELAARLGDPAGI